MGELCAVRASRVLIWGVCAFLPLFLGAADGVSSAREAPESRAGAESPDRPETAADHRQPDGSDRRLPAASYRGNPYVAVGPVRLDTRGGLGAQIPAGWTHDVASASGAEADPFHLVKFSGPVGSAARELLRSSGFVVVAYYPYNTFLVRPEPGRSAAQLGGLDGVVWTGRFHPYFKIGQRIADALTAEDPSALADKAGRGLRFNVGLHEGRDRSAAEARIATIPGVLELLASRGPIRIRVDPGRFAGALQSIAALPEVGRIERWLAPELLNDENVQIAQSGGCDPGGDESVRTSIFNRGLTGWNARLAIADTCIDANEGWFYDDALGRLPAHETDPPWTSEPPDWAQRKIVEYYDMYSGDTTMGCAEAGGNFKDHGTKSAGNAAGNCSLDPEGIATATDPANSDGDSDGAAPGARIIAQDLGNAVLAYLSQDGGTLGELVSLAYQNTCEAADCGVDVHNNSWGSNTDTYGEDARTGDAELWSLRDLIVLASVGNNGPGTDTMWDPATGKNVIAVGAAEECSLGDVAEFSSRGDTSDGRQKPDIMVGGVDLTTALNDGIGDANFNGGCSTDVDSGTSFASATAAGLAALILQYFQDGFYPTGIRTPADALDPSGALIKAMLINTAQQMTGTGAQQGGISWPNTDQGYGQVVLENSLYFDGDETTLWVHDEPVGVDVSGTSSMEFRRGVSGNDPLKVTLVWYDKEHPGSCGAATPCLLNDLDLTVLEEDTGITYTVTLFSAPNGHKVQRTVVPSGAGHGQTANDNGPDDLNTVEQIILYTPQTGTNYTFTVTAANTPDGPIPFALVASGNVRDTCEEISEPSNNQAVDLDDCADSGVLVSWDQDLAEWGDGGTGVRRYRVLREGLPITTGSCRDWIEYPATSCIDDTGPDGVNVSYRVQYESGCGAISTTTGAAATDQVPPGVTVAAVGETLVCPGLPISFTVDVTPPGGSYSYQWTEDGLAIPGETGTTLDVTKNQVESHTYNCRVTDLSTSCVAEDPSFSFGAWSEDFAEVDYDDSFDPLSTLAESCGDGDGLVEPGEYWEVTTRLVNASICATALNARADLAVNEGSPVAATICNATGYYGTIPPLGAATHTYTFQVDQGAECGNDIDFDVESIWWNSGGILEQESAFSVQAGTDQPGANESATQATDPLVVSDGLGFSTLAPAFTLIQPEQAQLDYQLACDYGPTTDIHTDEFNSLSGWSKTGPVSIDSENPDNCGGGSFAHAYFEGNGSLSRGISTSGFIEIVIEADFSGVGQYQNAEECLEWWYSTNGGSNWILYKSICGAAIPDGTWSCDESFAFPGTADDNSNFEIRFVTTGGIELRLDRLFVGGRQFPCDVTADTKVELVRSGGGGGAYLIKDEGQPDPPKPIDVTSFYNDADGGPGTWLMRITENVGGGAVVTNGVMSISESSASECDLTTSCSCPPGPPGEVSDDPPHFMTLGLDGTDPDLVFENLGAANYNIYVSTDRSTLPFTVTSGAGKKDCAVPFVVGPGGTIVVSDYDVEAGIGVSSDVHYILVTADEGSPDEGTLGFTTDGIERSADSYCAN